MKCYFDSDFGKAYKLETGDLLMYLVGAATGDMIKIETGDLLMYLVGSSL